MKDAPQCVSGRIVPSSIVIVMFIVMMIVLVVMIIALVVMIIALVVMIIVKIVFIIAVTRQKRWAGRRQTGIWKTQTGKAK